MDELIAVDVLDMQLKDVLEHIDALHRVKFQYDAEGIKDVTFDQPITIMVKDFPLRVLLKLLLEPVMLEWVVQDGAVVITSRSKAHEQLTAWKYDVNDLIAAGIPGDELAITIAAMVAPRTWDTSGGAGSVRIEKDVLVARQISPVHRNLQRLLRDIRRQLTETDDARRARERKAVTIRYHVEDFVDPELPRETSFGLEHFVVNLALIFEMIDTPGSTFSRKIWSLRISRFVLRFRAAQDSRIDDAHDAANGRLTRIVERLHDLCLVRAFARSER